jgi:hypothetical protein
VHSHFLSCDTKSRIISMHEMQDHDSATIIRISFRIDGKTQYSSDVVKPIIARGTRQYPKVLTISINDLL